MCEHGDTVTLFVPVPDHLSHSGRAEWKLKPVDRCIAPIVQALIVAGIYTEGCCCGHGKSNGEIMLWDGRVLEVRQGAET